MFSLLFLCWNTANFLMALLKKLLIIGEISFSGTRAIIWSIWGFLILLTRLLLVPILQVWRSLFKGYLFDERAVFPHVPSVLYHSVLEESMLYLFTGLSIENHINPFKLLILMIYFVENRSDPPLNFNDCWLFKDSLFWLPVLTFVSYMSVGNTCLILYLALVLTGLPYSLKPILRR